jgi:hypothetical protein
VTAGKTLTNADFIGFTTSTTSRTTSTEKDSSAGWQLSDVFSSEAESSLREGEFDAPARMLDQEQWSQMQISADYFMA